MKVKELLNEIQIDLDRGNLSLEDEVKIVHYYKEDGWYTGHDVAEDIDYTHTEIDNEYKKFLAIHL